MVSRYVDGRLNIEPYPVDHTNHETFGYLIESEGRRVVWAPEFFTFPTWAAPCDLMFAEAAGWDRPIRFRGNVGGHAAACSVATIARNRGVRRLVFAHIGWASLRAIDRGDRPPFGTWGRDGESFEPRRWRSTSPQRVDRASPLVTKDPTRRRRPPAWWRYAIRPPPADRPSRPGFLLRQPYQLHSAPHHGSPALHHRYGHYPATFNNFGDRADHHLPQLHLNHNLQHQLHLDHQPGQAGQLYRPGGRHPVVAGHPL